MCLMMTRRSSARGPPSEAAQHLLGAAADDGQRAADLVRDAGRQHADGDQLLGAHQLLLQAAQLGLILDEREGAHAQLVVLAPGRSGRGTDARPVVTEWSSPRRPAGAELDLQQRLAARRGPLADGPAKAAGSGTPSRIGPRRSVRKLLARTTCPSRETPSTPSGAFSTIDWLVSRALASACAYCRRPSSATALRCWRRITAPTAATATAAASAVKATRETSALWRFKMARVEASQVTTQLPLGRSTRSETCTAGIRVGRTITRPRAPIWRACGGCDLRLALALRRPSSPDIRRRSRTPTRPRRPDRSRTGARRATASRRPRPGRRPRRWRPRSPGRRSPVCRRGEKSARRSAPARPAPERLCWTTALARRTRVRNQRRHGGGRLGGIGRQDLQRAVGIHQRDGAVLRHDDGQRPEGCLPDGPRLRRSALACGRGVLDEIGQQAGVLVERVQPRGERLRPRRAPAAASPA